MDLLVECTHCQVLMTSWSAPGSLVHYYQCPFCTRTFSSLYGEVFRRHAGARLRDRPPQPSAAPNVIPLPTPDELRWKELKGRANRWFARLEAEGRRCADSYSAAPLARAPNRHR
jgi:hypothetical protein